MPLVASRLTVELLGPVGAHVGGVEVAVGGPVDQAVLALLALRAGGRVPTGDFLTAAYAGVPRASARRSLQSAVWRLRRALGDGLIVTHRDGYQLDIDPVDCDAGALREATIVARAARHAGDVTGAIAHLSAALRPWRGRNPDLPVRVADAIDDIVARAVEEWAELLLGAGQPAEALDRLERIGARERHPRLTELRAEAKRQCASLAPVVRDPMPAQLGALLASGRLVGRNTHLEALDGHRRAAHGGRARLVVIGGPRGAGTSRLAAEVAASTIDDGGVVWHGRAGADWAPLRAVADVVRDALAGTDVAVRSLALRGELGRLVPDLAGGLAEPAGDPDVGAVTAALVELVRSASGPTSVTIVLDDLREEDADLLVVARQLVEAVPQSRLLVVVVCGHAWSTLPAPARAQLTELLARPEVHELRVEALDRDEAVALLAELGPLPTDPQFADTAFELTGGLPRLLLAMHRNPTLHPADPDPVPDGSRVPGALTSARLATLPAAARAVVELAAVIAPAPLPELDAVAVAVAAAGVVVGSVVDSVAVAREAGVIVVVGDAPGTVAFRSPSVQQGVVGGLEPSHRARLHAAAAEGLQVLHGSGAGPHLSSIADHLVAAVPEVDPRVAVDAVLRSGEHLLLQGDAPAAASRFEQALAVLAAWRPGDVDRRITALLAAGRALATSGWDDEASAAWERAMGVAEEHDRPDGVALAALELAGTPYRPRRFAGAAAVLERAMRVLPPDADLRSLVVHRRVQLDRFAPAPGPHRVLASLPTVTDRLLFAGLRPADAATRATVALFQWVAGVEDGTRTLDDDERVSALIEQVPDAHSLQLLWDRWVVARAIAKGRVLDGETRLVALGDRIAQAEAVARTELQRAEVQNARRASALQLASLRSLGGRLGEARAAMDFVPADAREAASGPHFDVRSLVALFLCRTGDRLGAARLVDDVIRDLDARPHDRYRYATAMQIAYAAADLADPAPVRWLRAELDPHRGRHCLIGYSGYGGVTEHALGRLVAAAGDLDEADDLLAAGLVAHTGVGATAFVALSLMWRADALRRAGGADRNALADELTTQAGALFGSFQPMFDATTRSAPA